VACWVGIDIGLDGGIAALIDGAPMPAVFAMPTTETPVKRRRKGKVVDGIERDIDGERIGRIFAQLKEQATEMYVMIERAQFRSVHGGGSACYACGQPIPEKGKKRGQGLLSQAKFYGQYRQIIGILQVLGIPFEDVHPATWKADVFRGASDKTDARMKASQLFPALAERLSLKKNDGLAESVLLADYGRRRRNAPF
jgi:hypothetical protein